MAARWLRSLGPLACACVLMAGCADADPAALLERALAARAANAPAEFAALVSAASRACPDPDAARRLGEVAAIAARWSSAVLESRPKAQAVTEAQLTAVDWDALAAACVGAWAARPASAGRTVAADRVETDEHPGARLRG